MWGLAADRSSSKNKILIIQLLGCIVMLVAFNYAKGILILAICIILFSIVHNPMAGIYETITMEHVKKNGWNYSPIRMSGTIGYSIMSLIAGYFLSKRESTLFPIYILVTSITLAFAFMLPKTKGAVMVKKAEGKKDNVYVMLKNRRVRNVLILLFIYTLCNSFNATYYGIYMTALGGNYALVGIANMIKGFAEIPFHIGPGRRWMKKLGVEKCLILVMLAGAVRWTIAAFCRSPWMLVFTMAFNGFMLVPTIVGVVEFLYENAPDNLKASAQTGLKSPFQLGGQLLANLGFGKLVGILDRSGYFGIRIVYMMLVPICLLVVVLFGIPIFRGTNADTETGTAA